MQAVRLTSKNDNGRCKNFGCLRLSGGCKYACHIHSDRGLPCLSSEKDQSRIGRLSRRWQVNSDSMLLTSAVRNKTSQSCTHRTIANVRKRYMSTESCKGEVKKWEVAKIPFSRQLWELAVVVVNLTPKKIKRSKNRIASIGEIFKRYIAQVYVAIVSNINVKQSSWHRRL